MGIKKLRRINVDNEVYLWKRGHFHLTEYKHSKCTEVIVIYCEGYKNSALKLVFKEDDNIEDADEKWCVGYPDDGIIWLHKKNQPYLTELDSYDHEVHQSINFNRPAVISSLIKYYINNDWQPKERNSPLIIENALLFIEVMNLPID